MVYVETIRFSAMVYVATIWAEATAGTWFFLLLKCSKNFEIKSWKKFFEKNFLKFLSVDPQKKIGQELSLGNRFLLLKTISFE